MADEDAPEPSLDHDTVDHEVVDVFARLLANEELARMVAERAGFPRARMTSFSTPLTFWHGVVSETAKGAFGERVTSLLSLIAEAEKLYPHNPDLARCRAAVASAASHDDEPRGTVWIEGRDFWPLMSLWIHIMEQNGQPGFKRSAPPEVREVHQQVEHAIRLGRVRLYAYQDDRLQPVLDRQFALRVNFAYDGHLSARNKQFNGIGVANLLVEARSVKRWTG